MDQNGSEPKLHARRRRKKQEPGDTTSEHVRFKEETQSEDKQEPADRELPAFCVLSCEQVRLLAKLHQDGAVAEEGRLLESIFNLGDTERSFRDSILVEFYIYNLTFAADNDFTAAQTAVLFSILKTLLDRVVGDRLSWAGGFQLFRSLLLAHSDPRSGEKARFFSMDELRLITDYVTTSLFQHFSLYLAVFRQPQETTRKELHLYVEPPLPFVALQVAVTRHEMEELLAQEAARQAALEAQERLCMAANDFRLPPSPRRDEDHHAHHHEEALQAALAQQAALTAAQALQDNNVGVDERIRAQVAALTAGDPSSLSLGTDPNELISMLEVAIAGLRTKLLHELQAKDALLGEKVLSMERKIGDKKPGDKNVNNNNTTKRGGRDPGTLPSPSLT